MIPTAIIGAGAAGFFSAIHARISDPETPVILIEKTAHILAKVKISGGGRCNVTHACFDPLKLSESYPRGGKALIGPFQNFQPKDTMHWFESRGVKLKIEPDNRVFPVSDCSQSIIDCLLHEAQRLGVKIWTDCGVLSIEKQDDGTFNIRLGTQEIHRFRKVILATGSSKQGHAFAIALGHTITPLAPSLFTVKLNDPALTALSGLSVQHATLKLHGKKTWTQSGPLLITHWGLSGPALLKLSAFGARDFFEHTYQLPLEINWLSTHSLSEVEATLNDQKNSPKKLIITNSPFPEIPTRLWQYFVQKAQISETKKWQDFSKKEASLLSQILMHDRYLTTGKGQFKDEFVTCGGVSLSEVNFKTMESKICPGLFFAGEILDIDGITGGFNFQNAWTTGFLAGRGH